MVLPDLRVSYDSPDTVHETLDWLVDSDPIELRDIARNLLADVETLKAALVTERAAGRAEAIADLRDNNRYRDWWSTMAEEHPDFRYWADGRLQLADYLEARTKPAEVPDAD